MLGGRILKLLKSNPTYEVFSIGRSALNGGNHVSCDISNIPAFTRVLKELSPDYIVHCAANVNLENCEKEKEYTYRLHVVTSRVIASSSNVKKSIFISTDSVFDGKIGNYKEDDFVSPLNYYALTKALAEESFLNARHPSIVIRTNMFGFNSPPGNSLFEWAWNSLNKGNEISGYSNIHFNPLYVGTIAKIVAYLLKDDLTGLLHIGCIEGLSKHSFILKVADLFDFPHSLIKSSYAANNGPISRPMNTILNVQAIQEKGIVVLPTIEEELAELNKDFRESIQQNYNH